MSRKIRIFMSYSHKDRDMKGELYNHLAALRHNEKVEVWQDSELLGGDEFDPEIADQLVKADIILLLISVDFNNSQYIWQKELNMAMQRHREGTARVVPIILRDCDWTGLPYSGLNALPLDGKPVTSYALRDTAYTEIAKQLRRIVDYMAGKQIAG